MSIGSVFAAAVAVVVDEVTLLATSREELDLRALVASVVPIVVVKTVVIVVTLDVSLESAIVDEVNAEDGGGERDVVLVTVINPFPMATPMALPASIAIVATIAVADRLIDIVKNARIYRGR